MNDEIQIYVACLSAYNNGHLHGAWIDATQDLDDIQDAVNAMLKASPMADAEEWAIHDYEGFEGYELSEYEGLQRVHDIAEFLLDYPTLGGYLLNNSAGNIEDARRVGETYQGRYTSLADYAQAFFEDNYGAEEIPSFIEHCINWERKGKQMLSEGSITVFKTDPWELHVFSTS